MGVVLSGATQCSPHNFFKEWWRAGQALGQGGGRNVRDY